MILSKIKPNNAINLDVLIDDEDNLWLKASGKYYPLSGSTGSESFARAKLPRHVKTTHKLGNIRGHGDAIRAMFQSLHAIGRIYE